MILKSIFRIFFNIILKVQISGKKERRNENMNVEREKIKISFH